MQFGDPERMSRKMNKLHVHTMMNRLPLVSALLIAVAICLTLVASHVRAETPAKKIPVAVTADNLDYDRTNDVYTAVGHVKIEQEGVRLEADKVVLNNRSGEAVAEGKVYLQQKGDVVHAEKLNVNMDTQEGIIYKGDLFRKGDNYHIRGDVIERKSATMYHIEHGEFTTCDANDWFIKADAMDIDMARYATGRKVTFNVAGGVPVLYTPYFLFPVRRQTGFLIPDPGYSSKDGFFIGNTFFWAISDFSDLTVYSDYRERTGHGTGLDYRYNNSRESSGSVYAKAWDMYHSNESRWDFRFQHAEEFAEDLTARADINLVSDDHYYHDLEKKLEMRSKPYIDSNAFYVERWNTSALNLLGQYSIDLTQSNASTAQKLPELRYTIFEESLAGPLHLNFDGSATNFTKQDADGVRRADFNPQVSAAFGGSGFGITPRSGFRATFYDRSANSTDPTERRYVYAGMDVNARMSRVSGNDGDSGFGKIRHSIEPTVSYSYIPNVDQTDIPQFDSIDTVTAQNAITYSVINRWSAHYKASKTAPAFSTIDVVVLKLSQSYDLNVGRDKTSSSHASSDVLAELSVNTPKAFSLTASTAYNVYDRIVSSRYVSGTYREGAVSLFLADNYVQSSATHYVNGGGTLTLGRWELGSKLWRDVENRRTTEEDYSLHYGTQCWGVQFQYTAKPGEYRYTAMVDLTGLGSKGKSK